MLPQSFVILGTLVYISGAVAYVTDTIKGKAKPNKVTFFIWSLASLIAFAAAVKQGVGIQSAITLTVGLIPLTILTVSFFNKKAYWKITRFDLSCGTLSIIGLILWQATGVGNLAIIFSIVADGLAYVPTIRKSYTHPETENWYSYLASAVGVIIVLLTVKRWTFAAAAFPIYVLIADIIVFVLTWPKLNGVVKNH